MYAVEDVVARNLQETVRVLSEAGAKVDWVDLKWPASYATDWFDYWCVYLAAQHGHLLQTDRDLLDPDLAATLEAGQRIEAVRIERGAQARTRQWLDMARLFERYDALICPTMAKVAPRHTARDSDFEAMTPDGRIDGLDMTAVFNNVSVCPAISIPNWTVDDRLPTAVQVVGNRFDDPTVLRVAACLEKLAPWPIWPG
jgi:Asp-tRNA(Asn)/Glu-tRNA(Gln) amidotransferase A subunit family amidase